MKHICLIALILTGCSQYEPSSSSTARGKIQTLSDERHALEVEVKAQSAAQKEALRLRSEETDKLMAQLDSSSGSEALALFPKTLFKAQLALDVTTVAEVRAKMDKEAAEGKELGKANEVKSFSLNMVDHIKGSCILYNVGDKAFSPSDITSNELKLSPGGKSVVSKLSDQTSESCQTYFENQLATRYKEDYFSLHVGFITLPQDTK